MLKRLCILLMLAPALLLGQQSMEEMLNSLEIAAYWDKKLYERFPITYNHLLSGGYFTTHSARMTEEGEFGFGFSYVSPYRNYNGRVQPFKNLELSANYRVFLGIDEPNMGKNGFGDYADRGANFKFALCKPEDSLYTLPGIAVGIDDFMGTKKFTTYYIVGTQVMRDLGLEASFGWGSGTYTKGPSRGFFGGFNWFALWQCPSKWVRGIALTAEYDPTNYRRDPHPNGRCSHTPVNVGLKYNLCDLIELSGSYVKGESFAAAGSLHYNWGKSEGFLPKVADPLPYLSPHDREPLGCTRLSETMIFQMEEALKEQGFQLTRAWLEEGGRLWISLFNGCYRQEHIVRMRLQNLLAALTPSNISQIYVILESYSLPCQMYKYDRELLLDYVEGRIGPYEFDILTPRKEVELPPIDCSDMIYHHRSDLWRFRMNPRFETFLGNSKGKFKYDLGLKGSVEGFLPYNCYYELQASYTFLSSLKGIADFDFYHPSQLPNVATDYIRYRQSGSYTWDILYLQRTWNCSHGFFTRASAGYFQVNYAGVAGEALWYPAQSCFAIGLEGAVLKKRSYAGLGFQSKLRHFEGCTPVYEPYTTLEQYFLDFYLDFPSQCFFTKISLGQFLAGDKGGRLEATRYFNNGLRITGWITFTDAYDVMHGERYFDRGIALEIPLDFFYKKSSRRVWNHAVAAWLRDAGYATSTGRPLFDIINRERRW